MQMSTSVLMRSLTSRRKWDIVKNGLPVVYLIPGSIVEEHRLRRLQHHTLTPYSDAEGIRLLKEQWETSGSSSAYLTALDECYTAALLNGGPQKHLPTSQEFHQQDARSPGKEHSCLKVAYAVDGFDDIPEDDELVHVCFMTPCLSLSPHTHWVIRTPKNNNTFTR